MLGISTYFSRIKNIDLPSSVARQFNEKEQYFEIEPEMI